MRCVTENGSLKQKEQTSFIFSILRLLQSPYKFYRAKIKIYTKRLPSNVIAGIYLGIFCHRIIIKLFARRRNQCFLCEKKPHLIDFSFRKNRVSLHVEELLSIRQSVYKAGVLSK